MEKNIASLKVIRQSPVEKIFSDGFNRILNNNLTGNFQIPYLEKLIRDPQKPAIIDIEEIGKITIDQNIPKSETRAEKHNFSEDYSKEKTHKHLANRMVEDLIKKVAILKLERKFLFLDLQNCRINQTLYIWNLPPIGNCVMLCCVRIILGCFLIAEEKACWSQNILMI